MKIRRGTCALAACFCRSAKNRGAPRGTPPIITYAAITHRVSPMGSSNQLVDPVGQLPERNRYGNGASSTNGKQNRIWSLRRISPRCKPRTAFVILVVGHVILQIKVLCQGASSSCGLMTCLHYRGLGTDRQSPTVELNLEHASMPAHEMVLGSGDYHSR